MKRCAYCGRENADQATQCRECGSADLKPAEDAVAAEQGRAQAEPSLPARVLEKIEVRPPAETEGALVTLVTCGTLGEADLIVSDLESVGIGAFIPDQFAVQNFSLPGVLGSVRVQVAAHDFAAAQEFLNAKVINEPPSFP
jgi:hypothetical protein